MPSTTPTVHRLPIEEAVKLTDPEAIRGQIQVRRQQAAECVGWLYPSILADEIERLKALLP